MPEWAWPSFQQQLKNLMRFTVSC